MVGGSVGSLLPIFLLVLFAAIVVAIMLALPYIASPRRSTPVKQMPYESGMDPIGDARRRFDVRFYLVAIVFLLFDVELLFLYPWAVSAWHESGVTSAEGVASSLSSTWVLVEVLVFVALLGLAYVYAWRRGVFNWK
jgi:NADH-quinone oxidoreductase subunit A